MMLVATAACLALVVLALVAYRRRKESRKPAIVAMVIALLGLAGWAATYGRWEWHTWRHATELRPIVVAQFQAAQLPITTVHTEQDISEMKVFCYGADGACLHVEDKEGNKWQMRLSREGEHWTALSDGAWQIDMIHSVMGGSAQRNIYWY